MTITKELKNIAKRADYYFIHVDGYKAKLELMKSHDARNQFKPHHLATYDDIDCQFNDYSKQSRYTGKATIFVNDYQTKTLLALIQVLHIGTEISLNIAASNNSEVLTTNNLVNDDIFLQARKGNKAIGQFQIMASVGYDNIARPIRFK